MLETFKEKLSHGFGPFLVLLKVEHQGPLHFH